MQWFDSHSRFVSHSGGFMSHVVSPASIDAPDTVIAVMKVPPGCRFPFVLSSFCIPRIYIGVYRFLMCVVIMFHANRSKKICHRRGHVHGSGTQCRAVCTTSQKEYVSVGCMCMAAARSAAPCARHRKKNMSPSGACAWQRHAVPCRLHDIAKTMCRCRISHLSPRTFLT